MNTSTLQIELPGPLRAFVEEQASSGGYSTPGEYVQALLVAEQKRKAEAKLEELLLAGLRSEVGPLTPDDWETIRREGKRRLEDMRSA